MTVREGGARLDWDWFDGVLPANIHVADGAYLTTSHAFAEFRSEAEFGLELGEGAGLYDQAALVVGPGGRLRVGPYSCLSNAYVYAQQSVEIGAYVLAAWGCVITDHWLDGIDDLEARRAILRAVSNSPERAYPRLGEPRAVTIEDNVWLGFDSVVLPGTRIGRGSVIGARTVVQGNIPAYSVVVGNPARVVRQLEPSDSPESTALALRERLSIGGFGSNIRGDL